MQLMHGGGHSQWGGVALLATCIFRYTITGTRPRRQWVDFLSWHLNWCSARCSACVFTAAACYPPHPPKVWHRSF